MTPHEKTRREAPSRRSKGLRFKGLGFSGGGSGSGTGSGSSVRRRIRFPKLQLVHVDLFSLHKVSSACFSLAFCRVVFGGITTSRGSFPHVVMTKILPLVGAYRHLGDGPGRTGFLLFRV